MRKSKFSYWTMALLMATALVTGFHGVCLAPAAARAEAPPLPSFADLSEQVKHSVVNISTTKVVERGPSHPFFGSESPLREFFGEEFFKRFFGGEPQGKFKTNSLGSGVVIDADGTILTNNHVIEKADEIKIKLDDGNEYDAKIVGRDPKTDLALIQAKPDDNFPEPVPLGSSDDLRVGDWVMAVGNPFGFGHTVTTGIISAKGRIIGAGPYDDFLQTDAAINPGNSGGPLFNMKGEVVGINTAIVAQGQGIGFAIPVDMAKELLPQLKSGEVVRGWLGVMIQDISSEMAESFDLKDTQGALVGDVLEDSPAEERGLQRGDVVLAVDGKEVEDAHQLSRMVASIVPGTRVKIKVIRDGETREISVKVGTMPGGAAEKAPEVESENAWGITVQNLTEDMAQKFGWDENEKGVVVTAVEPDGPAAQANLRSGDLVKEINRRKIQNLRDYNEAMKDAEKDKPLLLLIKRGENTFYVVVKNGKD